MANWESMESKLGIISTYQYAEYQEEIHRKSVFPLPIASPS